MTADVRIEAASAARAFPLSYGIFRLARAHRAYAADLLRPMGLFAGQELIIMALAEGPRLQSELVELERVDHSTIARSLRRMEEAGLVSRQPARDDRRSMVVSLTLKGRALDKKIQAAWRRLERATVARLDPQQRATLLALMQAVEANVRPESDDDAGRGVRA